ncbi:sodium transporter [Pelomyxa schiedti]|nr:sodium transporter [Pelomyxa schiedti]
MSIAFWEVGGMSGLMNNYGIPDSYFNLLQPATDPYYPWPGMVFCVYASSLWYWCADQVMVQRALSAKNLDHGRAGTIGAAFLKILPLFMMSFVGVIAYALYPEEVSQRADIAYPLMVVRLLPNGLRGVMLSSMLSALMSTLASVFNSCSTLFTLDLWKHARPRASEHELVTVGRIATLFVIATSFAWLPLVSTSTDQIFVYIQSVSNYLAPPITAVFLAAVFTTRVSEKTVLAALLIGLFIGLCRFTLELVFDYCDINSGFTDLNYLYFGMLLALFCALIIVIGSILQHRTPQIPLPGLTWWTINDPIRPPSPVHEESSAQLTKSSAEEQNEQQSSQQAQMPQPDNEETLSLLETHSKLSVREIKEKLQNVVTRLGKIKILLITFSALYCAALIALYVIFD